MNIELFVKRLRAWRGHYKDVAAGAGVPYDVVRKYAQCVVPKHNLDSVKKITEWMRGKRP